MDKIFKALADEIRLKIIKKISNQEYCACELLKSFEITQPTLSHHMNVLVNAGLVVVRVEGKWKHYSLNKQKVEEINTYFKELI